MSAVKFGIIREGKTPPDARVPLTPNQCRGILDRNPHVSIYVQPSDFRCYSDEEYKSLGVLLKEDISDCDILLGVKEVPLELLIPEKTYLFFSHTIKKQPYNQNLLKELVAKHIHLVDYECLKNEKGVRVIAFGHWAGIVGAHNALYTWGKRTGAYELERAYHCHDYAELKEQYRGLRIPPLKIVLCGNGRVAGGAVEMLNAAGIKGVGSEQFLNEEFDESVFTELDCEEMYSRKTDDGFDLQEFFTKPELYKSIFLPYSHVADLFINAIYWDPKAPAFFTLDDMKKGDFKISAIADITCDIAPEASIPATVRATTIKDPIFFFDRITGEETADFHDNTISMMTVDNLPSELPRDASAAFGQQLIDHVLAELIEDNSTMITNASITINGDLGKSFEYLRDYLEGK